MVVVDADVLLLTSPSFSWRKERKTHVTLAEGPGGETSNSGAAKVEGDSVGSTFLPRENRMHILISTQGRTGLTL